MLVVESYSHVNCTVQISIIFFPLKMRPIPKIYAKVITDLLLTCTLASSGDIHSQ